MSSEKRRAPRLVPIGAEVLPRSAFEFGGASCVAKGRGPQLPASTKASRGGEEGIIIVKLRITYIYIYIYIYIGIGIGIGIGIYIAIHVYIYIYICICKYIRKRTKCFALHARRAETLVGWH